MQRLPIDKITDGMVTADAILSERGIVLCGAGTTLSNNLISRLKKLGIDMITVEGEDLDEQIKKGDAKKIISEIEDRFSLVSSDPLMTKFKEVIIRVLTGK